MKTRRPPARLENPESIDETIRGGLEKNSNAENYIGWIVDLCRPHLGERILEVGAGMGDFTAHFRMHGKVTATEISEDSLGDLRQRFSGDQRVEAAPLDLFGSERHGEFDTAVLINVLEHIHDDESAAAHLFRLLEPGGNVVIYVPAHWLLYSRFDNSLGHYRRYGRREMRDVLVGAGFVDVRTRYVNFIGAIGWFLVCRVLKRPASEGSSVGLMDKIVIPVARRIERIVRPPFGISVLATGRRPA